MSKDRVLFYKLNYYVYAIHNNINLSLNDYAHMHVCIHPIISACCFTY